MALSEEEQRMLEQLEASLSREDPRLASTLRGTRTSIEPRRILVGVAGFLLGLALLVGGMAWKWPLSLVGFAVMLAAAYYCISGRPDARQRFEVPGATQRPGSTTRSGAGQGGRGQGGRGRGGSIRATNSRIGGGRAANGRSSSNRSSSTRGGSQSSDARDRTGDQAFMDRLEERWKRRQEGR